MEFLSRPEDKKPRWTVTETCPEPHLVDDPLSRSPGESPPKVALLGSSPDQPSQNGTQTPPHQNGIQTPPPSQNGTGPAATERKRSRKAKGRERGVVLLTALEQEMIDWALGGFLPMGAEGLKPKPGLDFVISEITFQSFPRIYIFFLIFQSIILRSV